MVIKTVDFGRIISTSKTRKNIEVEVENITNKLKYPRLLCKIWKRNYLAVFQYMKKN